MCDGGFLKEELFGGGNLTIHHNFKNRHSFFEKYLERHTGYRASDLVQCLMKISKRNRDYDNRQTI